MFDSGVVLALGCGCVWGAGRGTVWNFEGGKKSFFVVDVIFCVCCYCLCVWFLAWFFLWVWVLQNIWRDAWDRNHLSLWNIDTDHFIPLCYIIIIWWRVSDPNPLTVWNIYTDHFIPLCMLQIIWRCGLTKFPYICVCYGSLTVGP